MPARMIDAHHHLRRPSSATPIHSLYRDYATLISSFEAIVSGLGLSAAESDAVFYANAERVYRL